MEIMTKQVKAYMRSKRHARGGSLALAGQCVLLLAACGGDSAGGKLQGNTGLGQSGTGFAAPAGTGVSSGVAGTFASGVAGSSTPLSSGAAGSGAAGRAAAGATAPTSGTGAAGTPAAVGGTGDVTLAGTSGGNGPTAGTGAGGSSGPNMHGACLDGITNYEEQGPFKFEAKTSGMVKLWVPMVPAGCKVPIVHLANGTTANCGNYQGALERLASHGFLTCCYEDPNTGAGTQGITAIQTAMMMYPDLADNKIGSTGHSQGGQAAFVVLQLAEAKWGDSYTYAGLAMEPASGFGTQPAGGSWQSIYAKIKSPMFMFSGDSSGGTSDGLVSIAWVQQGFDALSKTIEAYHWTAVGATHIPTPVLQEQEVSIPWFRWKLLGDNAACQFFKKMPDDKTKWKVQKEQNAAPCQ
jgi:hypothetical protein